MGETTILIGFSGTPNMMWPLSLRGNTRKRLRTSRCTGHWRVAVTNASSTIGRLLRRLAGRSPGCPRDSQGRRRAAEAPSKLEGSATSLFQAATIETAQAETSKTCAIPKPNLRHLCGAPPHPVARATWVMNP